LFKANNYTATNTNRSYELGNSFGVVYDNIKTIGVFGELKADVSKKVALGINATFNSFTTDFEKEAWNLPGIRFGSTLDVNITEKWFAGANLFFVGERKDNQFNINLANNGGTVTLDSYFDANLNLGYQHNKRLTAFLKVNNIANQAYQKWLNYPVQQLQLVLGASYKFDF
jgi:outer membrane cobalamin receptor